MAHLAGLITALLARRRIGKTCPETHACRRVHTNTIATLASTLAPNPGRIGLCYPDVPDLIMSRILSFLLLIVLLLALSFGWHPLATVKEVMRQRESYQVRQNGFNWLEQRKRRIADERERREPLGSTDPESVSSVVPSPMNGIDGAVPYSGIPKSGSTSAGPIDRKSTRLN